MVMAKRGRKRKLGERYPSGDLKPEIAPALWGRMRLLAKHNPILSTEMMRLSFHQELSDAQALVGFYIRDVYRHYCSYDDLLKTRNWGSSYGSANPSQSWHQPPLFGSENMNERERRRVQSTVEAVPRELRNAVLDLCVLNEPINPTIYSQVRLFLDRMASICEADWTHTSSNAKVQIPKPRLPLTNSKPSEGDPDREALMVMLLKLRPDLTANEMGRAADMFFAYQERERFHEERLTHRRR
jgi:hypothetical protein